MSDSKNVYYLEKDGQSDNPASQATSLLPKEMWERVRSKIEEDPMNLIPVNLYCNAIGVKTPVEAFQNFELDKEDVGIIVSQTLGTIPVLGSILHAFYLFWKRASPSEQGLTMEDVDKAINKMKQEILEKVDKMIDLKISHSEREMWKSLTFAEIQGVSEACDILFEYILLFTLKIESRETMRDGFLGNLRSKFELVRDKLRSCMYYLMDQRFGKYCVPLLQECLSLYTIVMRTLDAYYFQFGYDPQFASGRPKIGDIPELYSFSKRLHNKLARCIKFIGEQELEDNDRNSSALHSLQILTNSDNQLYPVPLYQNPKVKIPSFGSGGEWVHNVLYTDMDGNDKKGPFIYRFDAAGLCHGYDEQDRKYKRIIPERESATNCMGMFINDTNGYVKFKFNYKVDVQVRIFSICTMHDQYKYKVTINGTEELVRPATEKYGCQLYRELAPNSPFKSVQEHHEFLGYNDNINWLYFNQNKDRYYCTNNNKNKAQTYYVGYSTCETISRNTDTIDFKVYAGPVYQHYSKIMHIELMVLKNYLE